MGNSTEHTAYFRLMRESRTAQRLNGAKWASGCGNRLGHRFSSMAGVWSALVILS